MYEKQLLERLEAAEVNNRPRFLTVGRLGDLGRIPTAGLDFLWAFRLLAPTGQAWVR
jgi:hypothetical protein